MKALIRAVIPCNTPLLRRILVAFIRDEVRKVGVERVVLGLSGGVDSSLAAFLAAEALGAENVLGIRMPYRTSSPESLAARTARHRRARHRRRLPSTSRRRSTPTSPRFPDADDRSGAATRWRASA